MSQEIENENGEKVVVYTAEEMEATAKQRVEAEVTRVAAEKDVEIEKYKKVSAEKTENFRRYNEMSVEEKAAYDANTVELMKRSDKTAAEVEELRTKLAEKETNERSYTKSSVLKNFHGDKEDIKKVLEDKYAILAGMPENTPDEIRARAGEAAKLAGISLDSINPLYQSFNGEAPKYKEPTEFVETQDGKIAADMVRDAMGLPKNK